MQWDEGLTEEQRQAARHCGSHGRLLAGPGTGKSRCLARRCQFLVTEKGLAASEMIALTFTRAAACELRQKVEQALGKGMPIPRIATLHSFALSTLLECPARAALPQPLRVADDYEERNIVQQDLKVLLGLKQVKQVRDLLARLSADWEQLTADGETRSADPRFIGAWQEHRATGTLCVPNWSISSDRRWWKIRYRCKTFRWS